MKKKITQMMYQITRSNFEELNSRPTREAYSELFKLIKRARLYVQQIWDETKGTEREGSAMGAADTLKLIDEEIEKAEKICEEKTR